MEVIKISVSNNIRQKRLEKGYTQKQLGEKCGTSAAMIRQYELGLRNPKIETLAKISQALNITVGELDPNYLNVTQEKQEILSSITQLKQFIEKDPRMNIPSESNQKITHRIKGLIDKSELLIEMLDSAVSLDRENGELKKRNDNLKKDIQEIEQDIEEMCLLVFRQLNLDGQEKVIKYAADLTKIPEYRKEPEE